MARGPSGRTRTEPEALHERRLLILSQVILSMQLLVCVENSPASALRVDGARKRQAS